MGKLSDKAVKAAVEGRHSDGDCLYLMVSAKLSRTWLLRYQIAGKRRDMGLGSYPTVSLSMARQMAAEARSSIARGIDPIARRESNRRRAKQIPTFADVAKDVIAEAQARTSNSKVAYQIERHLGPAYCGQLLTRPVDEITTIDLERILRPIWREKPEVARKLYPAIRRVFEAARIRLRDENGITFQNPALWADLKAMGFEQPTALTRGHHPSLSYSQMPAFMCALREQGGISARLLEFTILVNVRTGAALLAKWNEFDLDAGVWSIPAEKLKDRKHRKEPFRVPLSQRAVEILRDLKSVAVSDYVFARKKDKPLSNMAMLQLLERMNSDEVKWIDPAQGKPITVHGFRATFKTWAEDTACFPHNIVETAMGHVVGSSVERAYKRTDLLEQRRKLMESWAQHCDPKDVNVISFRGREAI